MDGMSDEPGQQAASIPTPAQQVEIIRVRLHDLQSVARSITLSQASSELDLTTLLAAYDALQREKQTVERDHENVNRMQNDAVSRLQQRVNELEAQLAGKSVTQYDADKEAIARLREALQEIKGRAYGQADKVAMIVLMDWIRTTADKALSGQDGSQG